MALDYTYLAKTYFPRTLVNKSLWELVGSKSYYQETRGPNKLRRKELSRILFYCAYRLRIEDSYKRLARSTGLAKEEKNDFIKIDKILLPQIEDRLVSIDNRFKKGLIELIFHPMGKSDWLICRRKFEDLIGINFSESKILDDWVRGGDDQPRFLPAILQNIDIPILGKFNPLRTLHPMPGISFPRIMKNEIIKIENPPRVQFFKVENILK